MNRFLDISPEVTHALRHNRPVVALESTIITHGMPYPSNLETALRVSQTVRDHGAVPATIAIVGGRLKAGLTPAEIEHLAQAGKAVPKASRRDMPALVAGGRDAAASVAAAMLISQMAGIRVFATAGVGGAHRGAGRMLDISADLEELARTQVMVVCSGAKAVVDLRPTLEYLETRGVPLVSFGSDEYPAFFSRESGIPAAWRMDSAGEVAAAFHALEKMQLGTGMLVTNPVPEEFSMSREAMRTAVETALIEAEKRGITGKEVTPFLMSEVAALTNGESIETNIGLVVANAALAADIAGILCEIE